MSIENEKQIDLGFAEKCNPTLLGNVYFPSKIGGKPAWLDLEKIPSSDELKCKKCGLPQSFLCQIYAPLEDNPECFHRMIYIFVCREASCFAQNSSENFSAFRSQLPRQNTFFSAVPPDEDEELDSINPLCKICIVCGCRGSLMCSRCKHTNYCSAKHQRSHWPQHKLTCQKENETSWEKVDVPSINFPEYEIVIEAESCPTEDSDDEAAEKRRLEDFQTLVEQNKTGTMKNIPESELAAYANDDQENTDYFFRSFKDHISKNPAQVLRYNLGGKPLWIADSSKTIGDVQVSSCKVCNSERQFEFQIMPQMVNYLKDDNIDWGVLAVFTCKKSCNGSGEYAREFLIKQDILPDEVN